MPNNEFIKTMQDTLRKQQAQKELEIRNKLHFAEVIEARGAAKWEELKTALEASVHDINAGFSDPVVSYTAQGGSLTIGNTAGNRGVTMARDKVSAAINYRSANGSGSLVAHVTGNDIEYTLQQTEPSRGVSRVILIGGSMTVDKIVDMMLTLAIGPN
jgi:ribosomal protein S11